MLYAHLLVAIKTRICTLGSHPAFGDKKQTVLLGCCIISQRVEVLVEQTYIKQFAQNQLKAIQKQLLPSPLAAGARPQAAQAAFVFLLIKSSSLLIYLWSPGTSTSY